MKPAHHRGQFHQGGRRLVRLAQARDSVGDWSVCWRCGRTLAEHEPHKADGARPRWTAGHIDEPRDLTGIRDVVVLDGRPVAPEASTCNSAAGARKRNGPPMRATREW